MSYLSQTFSTVAAFIWLLPCVYSLVINKNTFLAMHLSQWLHWCGFLPSVCSLIQSQITFDRKTLITKAVFIWFLPCVGSLVGNQIFKNWDKNSIISAFIWLLCMCSLVGNKTFFLRITVSNTFITRVAWRGLFGSSVCVTCLCSIWFFKIEIFYYVCTTLKSLFFLRVDTL